MQAWYACACFSLLFARIMFRSSLNRSFCIELNMVGTIGVLFILGLHLLIGPVDIFCSECVWLEVVGSSGEILLGISM